VKPSTSPRTRLEKPNPAMVGNGLHPSSLRARKWRVEGHH
jgi:hypothetical protein